VTIIGLDVDPNLMMITMPTDVCEDLVKAIRQFACPGQRCTLHEFQSLAGWICWSLNAYPLLRPGLSTMYSKMSRKLNPHGLVWVSVSLCRELIWLASHIENSDGIHLINSVQWSDAKCDFMCYTDACPFSLGFWSPDTCEAFYCDYRSPDHLIYFAEGYAIVSTLHYALQHTPTPKRVVVFMDNSNTVDIFHSLHAQPSYNLLLITAVDLLLLHSTQLCVLHIPGERNVIADVLSCLKGEVVHRLAPHLSISTFIPPRLMQGALLK